MELLDQFLCTFATFCDPMVGTTEFAASAFFRQFSFCTFPVIFGGMLRAVIPELLFKGNLCSLLLGGGLLGGGLLGWSLLGGGGFFRGGFLWYRLLGDHFLLGWDLLGDLLGGSFGSDLLGGSGCSGTMHCRLFCLLMVYI